MKIGFIGAGHLGGGLARLAVRAGHDVLVSNSRDPRTLFTLEMQLGGPGHAGSAAEAAAFGDVVVVAIPFYAYRDLPVDALAGKIVVDTMHYFSVRDGAVPEIDEDGLTSAELLARLLPASKVVRAFNNLNWTELTDLARPQGASDRLAVPVAGDDVEAKQVVSDVVDSFGFDAVDIGALAEGRHTEFGGNIFDRKLDANGIRQAVGVRP